VQIPYHKKHWEVFSSIPFKEQPPIGDPPSQWVKMHKIEDVPDTESLPNQTLCRQAVRQICQNIKSPVLFGYACVMAWGMQGRGPGGSNHVQKAWKKSEKIALLIEKLRHENLTVQDSYNLFSGENEVPYLGPSYFTKLIYFFRPQEDAYIMDQWTGKSVNLLTRPRCKVVKLYGSSPLRSNTSRNYKDFCLEISRMSQLLGLSGDHVEQKLFSWGGKKPETWRKYVKEYI
jgi:hypothetical protein